MKSEELKIIISAKDQASNILGKVQKSVLSIGAAYMTWQAAKDVIGGIIKAGMESEQIWNQLEASLKRHGYEVKNNIQLIGELADETLRLANIDDEEYAGAVSRLLDHNVRLADTHRVIRAAADMARAKNIDLTAAIELLGKANEGVTETLRRYGIILSDTVPKGREFEEVLKLINQRFGGAAQADLNTTIGQIKQLSLQWESLQENIAKAFTPGVQASAGSFAQILAGVNKHFEALIGNLARFIGYTNPIIAANVSMAGAIGAAMLKAVDALDSARIATAYLTGTTKESSDIFASSNEKTMISYRSLDETLKSITTTYRGMHLYLRRAVPDTTEMQLANLARIDAGWREFWKNLYPEVWAEVNRDMNFAMKKMGAVGEATAAGLSGAFSGAANTIVNQLGLMRNQSANIFAQMAADFIAYFIDSILQAAAAAAAKLVMTFLLFDIPENDRRAKQSGLDFAKYFTSGISEGMGGLLTGLPNITPNLAGAFVNAAPHPSYGGGQTIINNHFHTVDLTPHYVRGRIAPAIERAANARQTGLVKANRSQTIRKYRGILN